MNTENTIRSNFESFVKGTNGLAADQVKLNDKRTGTYTNIVLAALNARELGADSDSDTASEIFETESEAFMVAIRSNVGSLARTLGCKPAKRQPKGQPKNRPVYTVPSSFSAAKSYILSAFELGVELSDDDDSPLAFTVIRNEVMAIKAEQAADSASPEVKAHSRVTSLCDVIIGRSEQLAENDQLSTIVSLIDELEIALNNAVLTSRVEIAPDAVQAAADKLDSAADKKATKKTTKKAA